MYKQSPLHKNIAYNLASYNLLYLQKRCKYLIESIIDYNITSEDSIYILNKYYIDGNYIIDKVIKQKCILYNFDLYHGPIINDFNKVINKINTYISIFNNKQSEIFVLFPYIYLNEN